MKNLLKKLSRADQGDRRQAIEREAAQQLEAVSGHAPPPEAAAAAWAASSAGPVAGERRLTVQERMAARR